MWTVVVMMMEWEARETIVVYFIDRSNACAALLISDYWTPVRLGTPRRWLCICGRMLPKPMRAAL